MRKQLYRFQFNAVLAITILSLATNVKADDPDKMPTAEAVMKKYVEASGGAEKLKSVKSMTMKAKFEIEAMGIKGDLSQSFVAPNKSYTTVDLGEMGSQTVVGDGNIAWDVSTMLGPRLLKGTEKARVFDQANMERMYDPMKFYKSVEVKGMEEVNGEKTYKVITITKDDFKTTEYYSIKTGLPVAGEAMFPSPMGEMAMRTSYKEYKDVNGVKFPSKIEVDAAGAKRSVTFETIEINKEVDKKLFEIPAEIKTMIENTDG